MLAGYGMVIAGVLTDHGRKQPLMTKMPEFSVLIIALLGLKGNLEMTLASRLSTMVCYFFINFFTNLICRLIFVL